MNGRQLRKRSTGSVLEMLQQLEQSTSSKIKLKAGAGPASVRESVGLRGASSLGQQQVGSRLRVYDIAKPSQALCPPPPPSDQRVARIVPNAATTIPAVSLFVSSFSCNPSSENAPMQNVEKMTLLRAGGNCEGSIVSADWTLKYR